ncbi:MAG: nitroreductase family deazaflavin-dependent oxidoreductase [Polyangiales bacterium]
MNSRAAKLMQDANVWVYRKTGGKLGGRFGGAPVLLLTTRGRKSGKPRVTPLLYLADGNDVVVVASKGGWPTHPLWYRNLQADPAVEVQIGRDVRALRARTANPDERRRLWPLLVKSYAMYADYQSWSDREIPVVILEQPTARPS